MDALAVRLSPLDLDSPTCRMVLHHHQDGFLLPVKVFLRVPVNSLPRCPLGPLVSNLLLDNSVRDLVR